MASFGAGWVRRSCLARGSVLVGVGSMAVAWVTTAAVPASATDPSPVVSYLDSASGAPSNTAWLSSAAPDGSSAIRLTPSTYATWGYGVSQDGNTLVLAEGTGSPSTASDFDRTYALSVVQRSGATTTTHVLSTDWDTRPAISSDGSVYWMARGQVWKYSGGAVSQVGGSLFAPQAGETVWDFTVSLDGTEAAVMYRRSATSWRVLAANLTTGRSGSYFESSTFSPPYLPSPATFVFMDDTRLLIGLAESTPGNAVGTLNATGGGWGQLGNLSSYYDLEPLGADWWLWQDKSGTTSYGTTTDVTLVSGSPTMTARSNGPTTFVYRPSTVYPPALSAADNPATSQPNLNLSTHGVLYGQRATYQSYALYLTPLPGQTFPNDSSECDFGLLQYSTNGGTTWTNLTLTTYAHPLPWPGTSQLLGNGYTQTLSRNTWFRWQYTGTDFTTSSTSAVREVTVAPLVSVTVTTSGAYKIVSGRATRVGGSAWLYKLVSGRYSGVALVPLSSTGTFNFGKRILGHGTYKVATIPDASWVSGGKAFTI